MLNPSIHPTYQIKNIYVLAAGLTASLIWGIMPFYAKQLLKDSPSTETFLFFASIVTGILFFTLVVLQRPRRPFSQLSQFISRVDWRIFLMWAVLAYTLAPILFYRLLTTNTPTFMVVLLTSLMPFFAAIIGHFFFKEPITGLQALGIALVIAGIVLLEWKRG